MAGSIAQTAPTGARPRRGLQCQKLAAEPKPEQYPQMNSPRRTVLLALPRFLNSCHIFDGKQPLAGAVSWIDWRPRNTYCQIDMY